MASATIRPVANWKVSAPATVKAADKAAALASARKQTTVAKIQAPAPQPSPDQVSPPVGPFTTKSGGQTGISWNAGSQDSGVQPVYKKLDVENNTNCNIQVMAWRGGSASEISPPAVIEDVICKNANATPPGSSNGTGEANLWVGGAANVKRAYLENAGVMNLGRPCTNRPVPISTHNAQFGGKAGSAQETINALVKRYGPRRAIRSSTAWS